MTRCIMLTPSQRHDIDQAANSLLPGAREQFLNGVARRLGHCPSNDAVAHAIAMELAVGRFPQFLCEGATK